MSCDDVTTVPRNHDSDAHVSSLGGFDIPAIQCLNPALKRFQFPCDIAYPDSPAASSASSRVAYSRPRAIFRSRIVNTTPKVSSGSIPLSLARPP